MKTSDLRLETCLYVFYAFLFIYNFLSAYTSFFRFLYFICFSIYLFRILISKGQSEHFLKYRCSICKKTDAKKNSVLCDKCNQWVHIITCNKITTYCHKNLQKENTPWYCRQCVVVVVPFLDLTDMQLNRLIKKIFHLSQTWIRTGVDIIFIQKNFSLQLLVIQCLKNMVNWQMTNLPLI